MLVEPSGCGKTTAMRMVNRMIDISAGDILLDGRSVRDSRPAELRREIGYAIQQISLFPHLSVADNIGTVPAAAGLAATAHRGTRGRAAEAGQSRPSRHPRPLPGQPGPASASAWAWHAPSPTHR